MKGAYSHPCSLCTGDRKTWSYVDTLAVLNTVVEIVSTMVSLS